MGEVGISPGAENTSLTRDPEGEAGSMPHDLGGGFPTSRAGGRARAKTREGRQIVWAEVHKGWWLQRWKYRDGLFSLLLLSWRNSHRPCFLSLVRVEGMLEVRRESNKYETVIFWERVRANELWKCSMIARQRFSVPI